MRYIPGFGSIRTRLVAMLVIAAVPLFGMAVVIAWQNYRALDNEVLQRTLLVLDAAAARHHAMIDGTELLLSAIAGAPVLSGEDPARCDSYLRDIVDRQPGPYTDIAVLSGQGDLLCSARVLDAQPDAQAVAADSPGGVGLQRGASHAAGPWFRRVVTDGAFTVMPPDRGPRSGVARIVAVVPIIRDGKSHGVVFAGLRLDWLLMQAAAIPQTAGTFYLWFVNDAGEPVAGVPPATATLPNTGDLPALINRLGQPQDMMARDGTVYCYVVARLGPGLRLLVGYSAARDLALARARLRSRAVEFGLLLVLGVVGIAIGANRAVRVPLAQLTEAVRRWRGGGVFDMPIAGLPMELRELSAAFSQTTAAIAAHELQLRSALTQQEVLMQEIHHRVKNNMQIVASLLNLQAARIRQPEAKAEFQSARDRVRALATLHRHLYAHGEVHTINMRSFLNELCTQLFQAFGETVGQRIRLEIDAPELRISSDQAVPLALIVTETVSNAIKYAFPAERSGTIRVRLTEAASRARLVIEDDGIGLQVKRAEPGGGIGLQLVRGFARQIGATLTVESEGGMRYVIDMPVQQQRDNASRNLATEVADLVGL